MVMPKRRTPPPPPKKRDPHELTLNVMMVALAFVGAGVVPFLWEWATGLTFAGKNDIGEISTPESLARARQRMIFLTVIFGPVAFWCYRDWSKHRKRPDDEARKRDGPLRD